METVVHGKKKDVAYQKIRQMIVTGQLIPGQKITEANLAQLLNIGRTPVREAVLSLEQDQLVYIHPRKYIEIAPISPERINNLFELRIYLEPAILRKHTATLDLVRLMDIQQRILDNIAAYDRCQETKKTYPSNVTDTDAMFHQLIIDASNNDIIRQTYNNLMDYNSLLWAINSRLAAERSLQSDREHLQIINAILNNDINGAAKLLEDHLTISRNAMIRVLIMSRSGFPNASR